MAVKADDKLRDKLKATRERKNQKKDELAQATAELDQAKETFASSDKELGDKESAEFKAVQDAFEKQGNIKDEIAQLEAGEATALGVLGEDVPGPGSDPRAVERQPEKAAWDGHGMLRAEGGSYRDAKREGIWHSDAKFGSVTLGEIASREEAASFFAAPIGSADVALGMQAVDRRGIVAPQLKPLSLLDLIPTGTTDANSIEYVQITALPTGAAETAELAAKPELGLGTEDAVAPVRTIAGWIKLARQALDDMSTLGTLINTLLPYEVRRRIESQILVGDGVGQNLTGILTTDGIGAPAVVLGDNPADAILRAMTTVVLSDGDPNFVALNPLTWQDILLEREVGGHTGAGREGQYILGAPGQMAAPTLWGLALTPNRVVPQASPLVGDAMGATLLVREGVRVRISDSDQDDFTKNRVTVLCEARVAFPVWRPASFAVADWTP